MLLKNPGAKIPNMIGLAAELSGARLFIGNSIISKNKHKNSYLGFLQNPGFGLAAELRSARLCIGKGINRKKTTQ